MIKSLVISSFSMPKTIISIKQSYSKSNSPLHLYSLSGCKTYLARAIYIG